MEALIHLLRMYPTLISGIVQGLIYAASMLLLIRGFWLTTKALWHLRKLKPEILSEKAKETHLVNPPLSLLTAQTLYAASKEYEKGTYPQSFIEDATRQVAENVFETKFIRPISMVASLLPPIGFIGTVFGMTLIFLAKADPNSELNTAGLGAAMFTTLGALTFFVLLESFKLVLYRLSVIRIDNGLQVNL